MDADRGPSVDASGAVCVRVPLTADRTRTLLQVLGSEISWYRAGVAENAALRRLSVEARSAVRERRSLVIPAWDFEMFRVRIGAARLNSVLSGDAVVVAREIASEFDRAAEPTGERDLRRRHPHAQAEYEAVPTGSVSEAELARCGWHSAAHLAHRYPGSTVDLPTGGEPELEAAYLNGLCAAFAVAVQEAAGGTLVVVRERWERAPVHAAVRLPDGCYADARGHDLTAPELVAGYTRWRETPPEIVEVERVRLVSAFLRHPANYEAAKEHMTTLLPDLAPNGPSPR